MGISAKLLRVIGDQSAQSWALERSLSPQTIHEWIKHDRAPRRASMRALVEATGIPEAWWRYGSGDPPGGVIAEVDYRAAVPERRNAVVAGDSAASGHRGGQGRHKINADALAAIIYALLAAAKGKPDPDAIARGAADAYERYSAAGIITPTGLHPKDSAA